MRCERILNPNPNPNSNLNLSPNLDLYHSHNLNPNPDLYLNLNRNHNLNLDLYLSPSRPILETATPPGVPRRGRTHLSPTTTSRSSLQHPKSGAPARGPPPSPTPTPWLTRARPHRSPA